MVNLYSLVFSKPVLMNLVKDDSISLHGFHQVNVVPEIVLLLGEIFFYVDV